LKQRCPALAVEQFVIPFHADQEQQEDQSHCGESFEGGEGRLWKKEFERFGADRSKTEGPSRIPATTSPTKRGWPTLRAIQPPARVANMITDIPIKRSVKGSHAPMT
jgi:hypothetical protein